jgi:hypothetical protein
MSFTSNDSTNALVEFGCLVPNCQQSDWSITSEREVFNKKFQMDITLKDQLILEYVMFAGLRV